MFDIHLFVGTVSAAGEKSLTHRAVSNGVDFSAKSSFCNSCASLTRNVPNDLGLIRHVREVTGLIELVWKRAAGFAKETPNGRTGTIASGRVLSLPRLGGLRHRYDRAA